MPSVDRPLPRTLLVLLTVVAALSAEPTFAYLDWELTATVLVADSPYDEPYRKVVDISGGTAIIGDPSDQSHGTASGAAYLVDVATGTLRTKLQPIDSKQFDSFGYSVAIDGGVAAVGSFSASDPAAGIYYAGAAYLFDVNTGAQLAKLEHNEPIMSGDQFGASVDISGGIAIVGSPEGDNRPGPNFMGAAHLFDVVTGQMLFKLLPSDEGGVPWFGVSVGISGNTAIVGASPRTVYGFPEAPPGAAFLFDASTGAQLFKLTPDDGLPADDFGTTVAIDGNLAIVGSPGQSAVYIFDVTTGDQLAKIEAPSNFSAMPVAINNGIVIMGGRSSGHGVASYFDLSSGQQGTFDPLIASPEFGDYYYGRSVAFDGVTAIVATTDGFGAEYTPGPNLLIRSIIRQVIPEPTTAALLIAATLAVPRRWKRVI